MNLKYENFWEMAIDGTIVYFVGLFGFWEKSFTFIIVEITVICVVLATMSLDWYSESHLSCTNLSDIHNILIIKHKAAAVSALVSNFINCYKLRRSSFLLLQVNLLQAQAFYIL